MKLFVSGSEKRSGSILSLALPGNPINKSSTPIPLGEANMFYETTMKMDLGELAVQIEVPILVEYSHHKRIPGNQIEPPEPEHVEIKSMKAIVKRPCGYQDISWAMRLLNTEHIEREILESLQ
jgi:hypothetical protein